MAFIPLFLHVKVHEGPPAEIIEVSAEVQPLAEVIN